jgi:hypothetical protein
MLAVATHAVTLTGALGNAQVAKLDMGGLVKEKVLRLDVSIDVAELVDRVGSHDGLDSIETLQ